MIYDLLDDGTTDTTVLYHGKIDERYPCLKSINAVMLHLSDFGGIRTQLCYFWHLLRSIGQHIIEFGLRPLLVPKLRFNIVQ
jgi:hypothetical protein